MRGGRGPFESTQSLHVDLNMSSPVPSCLVSEQGARPLARVQEDPPARRVFLQPPRAQVRRARVRTAAREREIDLARPKPRPPQPLISGVGAATLRGLPLAQG